MTISSSASTVTVLGNGATSSWNFSFVADTTADIEVLYTNSLGVSTVLPASEYTLTINAPAPGQIWGVGGAILYPTSGSPIATGTSLTITRTVPLLQTTSISNQGDFYPQAVEAALDTLCMEIQQVSSRTGQFRGTWATGIVYNYGDIVVDGVNGADTGNFYMCILANTSAIWATDLAAGDWTLAFTVQQFGSLAATQVTLQPIPAGAPITNVQIALNSYITPEMYGAMGNGVTDDTAALTAFFAALNTGVVAGKGMNGKVYKTSRGIAADMSKFTFDGQGCEFDCANIPVVSFTGTLSASSTTVSSVSSTAGLAVGMNVIGFNIRTLGTTTNGSAVITDIPSTTGMIAGMTVYLPNNGNSIQTTIDTVNSGTEITLASGTGVVADTGVPIIIVGSIPGGTTIASISSGSIALSEEPLAEIAGCGLIATYPWAWLYSSVSFPYNFNLNNIHGLSNCAFFSSSGAVPNSIGLQIGHAIYTSCSDIHPANISIDDCGTPLRPISNCWRLRLDSVQVPSAVKYALDFGASAPLINAGESMQITGCSFVTGVNAPLYFSTGQWTIGGGTSILGGTGIIVNGDAAVSHKDGNMESLNVPNYLMGWNQGPASSLFVEHSGPLQSSGGLSPGAWTLCPYRSDTVTGITRIEKAYLQEGNVLTCYEDPRAGGLNCLISGKGRVGFGQAGTFNQLYGLGPNVFTAQGLNMLANGNWASNATAPWVVATTGTVVVATQAFDLPPYGSSGYALYMDTTTGSNTATVSQIMPCNPGDFIMAQGFVNYAVANSVSAADDLIQIIFLDQTQTLGIAAIGDTANGSDVTGAEFTLNTWTYMSLSAVAPPGAAYVQLKVFCASAGQWRLGSLGVCKV